LVLTLAGGCDFGSNSPSTTGPPLAPPDASESDVSSKPPADAAKDAPAERADADATPPAQVSADATVDALPADSGVPHDATLEGSSVGAEDAGEDAVATEAAAEAAVITTNPDASDAAVVVPPVTVTIAGAGGPEPGVSIVFHDPTGVPLTAVQTDGTGSASSVVPPGSQITAIFGTLDSPQLITVAGAQPGDTIPLFDPTARTSTTLSLDLSLSSVSPPEGTANYSYIVADDCSQPLASTETSIDLASSCIGPDGLFPVLVLATGGGGAVLGYSSRKDNPSQVDGGGALQVAVPGAFTTTLGTVTVASLRQIADGVPFTEAQSVVVQDDGTTQTIFSLYPRYPDAIQAEVDLQEGASLLGIASREAVPALSGTDSFDLTELAPAITGTSIDVSSSVVAPSATWTATGALANGAAGMVVTIRWSGQDDGGNSQTGSWTLVVPATATNVVPPLLLDALSAYGPNLDSQWSNSVGAAAMGGSLAPNYDVFRAIVGGILNARTGNGALIPVLPAVGTLTVSAFVPD
jgi:hypothetical protein